MIDSTSCVALELVRAAPDATIALEQASSSLPCAVRDLRGSQILRPLQARACSFPSSGTPRPAPRSQRIPWNQPSAPLRRPDRLDQLVQPDALLEAAGGARAPAPPRSSAARRRRRAPPPASPTATGRSARSPRSRPRWACACPSRPRPALSPRPMPPPRRRRWPRPPPSSRPPRGRREGRLAAGHCPPRSGSGSTRSRGRQAYALHMPRRNSVAALLSPHRAAPRGRCAQAAASGGGAPSLRARQ